MQVSIHAAKTHLSKLIEAALKGEEVVIARGAKPVARIVPIAQEGFRIGFLRDRLPAGGPDFLEPMGEEELADWEGRS